MLLNILQRKHRTVPKMRNDPAPAVDSMEVKKLPKNHCVSFENQHKGANKVICEKKNRNTSITKQNKTSLSQGSLYKACRSSFLPLPRLDCLNVQRG